MARPTTKLERLVTELSATRLPKIAPEQEQWIFDKCMLHKGYATKNNVLCLDCGDTFSPELISRKRATCPHCDTKVKIENTRKRTDYQYEYASIALIFEGFQVIRNYEIHANYRKGQKASYRVNEVLQYWITPEGKVTMIGHVQDSGFRGSGWSGNWSIRKTSASYYNTHKYRVYPYLYLPGSRFKKEYTRFGINRNIVDSLTFTDAIKIVPNNPKAETLLKAKQYALLSRMKDYPDNIETHWNSIKICLRNKYKVEDAGIWIDYLHMLNQMGKDTRNAKYVCPKNLKKAHNIYVEKKRRIRERENALHQARIDEEERLRKQYLAQFPYKKRKAAFMGLRFSNKTITVKFLESEKAIKREGEILDHCVYENEYQNKDTLLFSATIRGKKIATVEVDPKKLKVLQVRGYDNNVTEYDEQIIQLVQMKMRLIAERAKPKLKEREFGMAC